MGRPFNGAYIVYYAPLILGRGPSARRLPLDRRHHEVAQRGLRGRLPRVHGLGYDDPHTPGSHSHVQQAHRPLGVQSNSTFRLNRTRPDREEALSAGELNGPARHRRRRGS